MYYVEKVGLRYNMKNNSELSKLSEDHQKQLNHNLMNEQFFSF